MMSNSDGGKLVSSSINVQAIQGLNTYALGGIQSITIKKLVTEDQLKKQQLQAQKAADEAAQKEAAAAEAKKQEDIKKAQQALASKSTAAKAPVPAPAAVKPAPVPSLIDSLPLKGSNQAILILGSSTSTEYTKCEVYERVDKQWSKKWTSSSVVGRRGMSANRHEGDKTTPMGIFSFLFQFGSAPNPGVKMEYRQTSPGDLWTSNPNNINEYNTWIHYTGDNPMERFYDYEDLYATSLYKYAAAVDFNYGSDKVLGKGSAIFLHISPSTGRGTSGCIGLPEGNLLQVLRWMDPTKNPKIVIGTEQYLRGLK